MASVFPTEIYEQVIDSLAQFQKPHKALRNCALVCWAWVPRSRLCLFRSISFASTGSEGVHRLAKLLDEAPHLRLLIQEVKLSMTQHPLGSGPQSRETIEILPFLLYGKLPALRNLRLSAMNRNARPLSFHSSFFPALAGFQAVTTLGLYHVTYARSGDFVRMIAILPNLQTLECGYIGWIHRDSHIFDPLRISTLRFEGANYDAPFNGAEPVSGG